jgi:menaquinone-dependent protoporphyrinogen oxidase
MSGAGVVSTMADVLTVYATGEGQTAKVADRIAEELGARGNATTTVDASEDDPDVDPADFDAVLVGASIHYGRQQQSIRRWVSANRDALAAKPNGFFQVSMSSGTGGDEGTAEAAGYVEEFVDATGWRPDRIGLFGGALRFSEYGFLRRALVKFVTRKEAFETDDSGDVEFTDWESVTAFADEFARYVAERTGEGTGAGP